MNTIPIIPERLEEWTTETIDSLIGLRDIESETFDFKSKVKNDLSDHICAMANSLGGCIVLGIEEIRSPSDPKLTIGFKNIGKQISNSAYNVEPVPKVGYMHIKDKNDRFYTVLKIASEDINKPYFLKNGSCYVRIGSSSKPAIRSTILNLATNKIISRDTRLQHTNYLKEIYRKSIGIRPVKNKGLLRLEIPTDYNEYVNSTILAPFRPDLVKVTYQDIKYMKHWDWAISHLLDHEYTSLYQTWKDIERLMRKYDENAISMKLKIESFINENMKREYGNFKEVQEFEDSLYDCYSTSNISDTLFRHIINNNDSKPNFSYLKTEVIDDYYIIPQLIHSKKKENLKLEKLISILQAAFENTDITNQRKELDNIIDEAYSSCRIFSKQLKSLVDDFDGGDVIKGSCKLGF
jgi:Putative DNA-binding domain